MNGIIGCFALLAAGIAAGAQAADCEFAAPVRGRLVSVTYDRDGTHYGRGKGVTCDTFQKD